MYAKIGHRSSDFVLLACAVLQAQYKDYVTAIILRKNSLTGVVYRDDPTILAWDIANEPSNPGDDSGDILQVWKPPSFRPPPLPWSARTLICGI